jgi:hypothetical protein
VGRIIRCTIDEPPHSAIHGCYEYFKTLLCKVAGDNTAHVLAQLPARKCRPPSQHVLPKLIQVCQAIQQILHMFDGTSIAMYESALIEDSLYPIDANSSADAKYTRPHV